MRNGHYIGEFVSRARNNAFAACGNAYALGEYYRIVLDYIVFVRQEIVGLHIRRRGKAIQHAESVVRLGRGRHDVRNKYCLRRLVRDGIGIRRTGRRFYVGRARQVVGYDIDIDDGRYLAARRNVLDGNIAVARRDLAVLVLDYASKLVGGERYVSARARRREYSGVGRADVDLVYPFGCVFARAVLVVLYGKRQQYDMRGNVGIAHLVRHS